MKRFLLFTGWNYDSSGGWNDFKASFDTLDEAAAEGDVALRNRDWYHIVDSTREDIAVWKHRTVTGDLEPQHNTPYTSVQEADELPETDFYGE